MSDPPQLNNLDLKLLLLFKHIHQFGNLSRAAEQLGLTQPAVSLALGRLRQHFGDPLFVRLGGKMVPTAAAEELIPLVYNAIVALQATLGWCVRFDPAQAQRVFRIAMTDVGQIVVLPRILNALARAAPSVRLHVRTVDGMTATQLQQGELDIAMGFLPDMSARFIQRPLFEETFSCLVSKDHPHIHTALTHKQYCEAQHVIVQTSGTNHLIIENTLRQQGITRHIGVQIPNFLGLATVVGNTHLVATLPSRAARLLSEQSHTRVWPLPVPMSGYQVRQHWHEYRQKDPGHIWLRNLIADLMWQS